MDRLRPLNLSAHWVTVPGALAFNKYSLAKTLYLTVSWVCKFFYLRLAVLFASPRLHTMTLNFILYSPPPPPQRIYFKTLKKKWGHYNGIKERKWALDSVGGCLSPKFNWHFMRSLASGRTVCRPLAHFIHDTEIIQDESACVGMVKLRKHAALLGSGFPPNRCHGLLCFAF